MTARTTGLRSVTTPRRQIAEVVGELIGRDTGVEFVAFDGSRWGGDGSDVRITIESPKALSYLATANPELGIARAYISGALTLQGELYTALRRLGAVDLGKAKISDYVRALRDLGPGVLHYEAPPPQEVGGTRIARGLRHALSRDAAAIHHHYDVSNTFYRWVLGPSMAYTCAVFPTRDSTLEQAQAEKFDLVCRKLDLQPGQRLLDVGCGWGGMVQHAVKHYGVTALGVTLSAEQASWGAAEVAEQGLGERATIRHGDYRHVTERGFDAVSSIGLTEHIGVQNYPFYFRHLLQRLRPQGRLLNHSIMRPDNITKAITRGGFINHYVFPDGEATGLGKTMVALQDNGFEPRHTENLREHYALTLTHWCANLAEHWEEAVAEVGLGTARVWWLYMTASRIGFEDNNIQLQQILATRSDDGDSGMPLRPYWKP